MQQVYIGLGANLGDARAMLEHALLRLAALPHSRLRAQSSLYSSAPVDAGGDDYINAVALLETELDALSLLHELQQIELACGRERPYRNAPRTLDLDILLYGDQQISSTALSVPHPRLTERAFVLRPLLELAPAIGIPGKGEAQAFLAAVAGQRIRRLP